MKYHVPVFVMILSIFCGELVAEITSVVEIPAAKEGDTVAIFISGDGGWRKIDQDISVTLASQGIHIVGVNSMRYFWKKRTPYEAAGDFNILINKYAAKTNRKYVIIIGYSFGADVAPYIINRLPDSTKKNLKGGVLLGLSSSAIFEVSAAEWLGRAKGGYPTLPEILKTGDIPLLIIDGGDNSRSIAHKIDRKKHSVVITGGGHHFGGNYNSLAWIIIDWYRKTARYR